MRSLFKVIGLLAVSSTSAVNALTIRQPKPGDYQLPPTPSLPPGLTPVIINRDGVSLWMQQYNMEAGGTPIVFIHGGGGSSRYMGLVIDKAVKAGKYCIAVDRRGHGLSTMLPDDVWSFDMFAKEISAQLQAINVKMADWVGWSDGAATTYAALQIPTINAQIRKAFVFAGFMTPQNSNPTYVKTPIYQQFVARVKQEYSQLQPQGNFAKFVQALQKLEATQPQFTTAGLRTINGAKVAVVSADHDEAVNLDVPAKLHNAIPGSTSIVLTGVSHFAPLQDPEQFTRKMLKFLGP